MSEEEVGNIPEGENSIDEYDTTNLTTESTEDEGSMLKEDDEENDLDGIEDPDIEAMKARVKEMEEEAEKLKEMQKSAEETLIMGSPTSSGLASPTASTITDKSEADARSVYVGNVDYSATATDLEQHFHGCGSINRVTILCDRFTGSPKGFAYVEFNDKESVETACQLTDSLFKGRQIKISPKRTNVPGVSTTNRFPRFRGRGRGRGYFPRRGRSSFRSRRAAFYSPY